MERSSFSKHISTGENALIEAPSTKSQVFVQRTLSGLNHINDVLFPASRFPLELQLFHFNNAYEDAKTASENEDGIAALAVLFQVSSSFTKPRAIY